MKLLLDECVTSYLRSDFSGHDVLTIEEAGFKGLKNGELLEAASRQFDVFITVDQNLRYQQNLTNLDISVLVLKAARSTYPMLRPLIPAALEKLESIAPGDLIVVS